MRQGPCRLKNKTLRCRGLPFRCSAADIAHFFSQYEITEDDVTLGMRPTGKLAGKNTGEALVQFRNECQARKACQEKNMKAYLKLHLVSKFELENFNNMQTGTSWLNTCGLPFATTAAEVAQLFEGYGIAIRDIIISQAPDGRPRSDAFIRFKKFKMAQAAKRLLDFQFLGKRYIKLFHCSRREVAQLLQDAPYRGPSTDSFAVCAILIGVPYLPATRALPVGDGGNHPRTALTAANPTWAGAQMPTTMPSPSLGHPCLAAHRCVEEPSCGMGGVLEKGKITEASTQTSQSLCACSHGSTTETCGKLDTDLGWLTDNEWD